MSNQSRDLCFGDYVSVEMKRYGADNEHYTHKVIGIIRSNTWIDVPVDGKDNCERPKIHGQLEDIVLCVCCGVCEERVDRYSVKDVKFSHRDKI